MPVYLVTPMSFRYRTDERLRVLWSPSRGSFAVHVAEIQDGRDAIRVIADDPPLDLGAWTAPARYEPVETLTLSRKVYRGQFRYYPRERRRLARKQGRRRATAVPMAELHETIFYVSPMASDMPLGPVAEELAVTVARVWHCPWWRRGQPLTSAFVDVPTTATSAGCSWASRARLPAP